MLKNYFSDPAPDKADDVSLSPLLKESERGSISEEPHERDHASPSPRLRGRVLFLLLPLLAVTGGFSSKWGAAREPRTFAACSAQQREGASLSNPWLVPGTPQEDITWSEKEEILRQYRWTAPEVDNTLKRVLANLTESEQRTREWLRTTRAISAKGVGIGLGSTSPPELIRPTLDKVHCDFPGPREGPGHFAGGSYEKYAQLLEEWHTGQQPKAGQYLPWMQSYTQMHAEMIAGSRPPRLIEYACVSGAMCGGLGDRMLGLASTFLTGVLSHRAMIVNWEHEIPFDMLFDSPYVDWSTRFRSNSTSPRAIYNNATVRADHKRVPSHDIGGDLATHFQNLGKHRESWMTLDALNRGIVLQSFYWPNTTQQLQDLGLTVENAYASLVNYLVRPKAGALSYINAYSSVFDLPSVFSIGIHIRTGDYAMYDLDFDKGNTVAYHQHFFTCADEVAKTYARPSQRIVYYLITDSAHLRKAAVEAFPSRVVISGLPQKHQELGGPEHEKETASFDPKKVLLAADGLHGTIAESWSFSATDFKIVTTHSGFGRIPTWLSGRQGRAIQLDRRWPGVPAPEVDCRVDASLSTFSSMGISWSMG